ncbi:MAG: transposase [Fibrobacterota bacterium]
MAGFSDRFYTSQHSRRLMGWDYGMPGYYFVTICIKDKEPFFGNVADGNMVLSEIGRLVEKTWFEIPLHTKTVRLDAFICMPDHAHGIIVIANDDGHDNHNDNGARCSVAACCDATSTNEPQTPPIHMSDVSGLSVHPNSLPAIIRSFKSACTKHINRQFPDARFQWQPRYYDHIIRDKESLGRIRNYIQNNPVMYRQKSMV